MSPWPISSVVVTVEDRVRVRSAPGTGDDSRMLDPLLPLGSPLFVLAGPVAASGYAWYEVVPVTTDALPMGWVAAASRTGDPWLAAGEADCPPVPIDLAALAALPLGTGPACFTRLPITVEARIVRWEGDIDGGYFTPEWFSLGSTLLVEPSETRPPQAESDWFVLRLDPGGSFPDPLPIGDVVTVTGIFDHPAAAGCEEYSLGDDAYLPSSACRLMFAVTVIAR